MKTVTVKRRRIDLRLLYLHIENQQIEVWPDHIHMLLDIPPKITVSSFLGYTPGFAEGYLFVRFLGLLLLLFSRSPTFSSGADTAPSWQPTAPFPPKTLSFSYTGSFLCLPFLQYSTLRSRLQMCCRSILPNGSIYHRVCRKLHIFCRFL